MHSHQPIYFLVYYYYFYIILLLLHALYLPHLFPHLSNIQCHCKTYRCVKPSNHLSCWIKRWWQATPFPRLCGILTCDVKSLPNSPYSLNTGNVFANNGWDSLMITRLFTRWWLIIFYIVVSYRSSEQIDDQRAC